MKFEKPVLLSSGCALTAIQGSSKDSDDFDSPHVQPGTTPGAYELDE